MINMEKLKKKLEWLLGRARYAHISTTARVTLVSEVLDAVKECEITKKPKKSRNTLKTAKSEGE